MLICVLTGGYGIATHTEDAKRNLHVRWIKVKPADYVWIDELAAHSRHRTDGTWDSNIGAFLNN